MALPSGDLTPAAGPPAEPHPWGAGFRWTPTSGPFRRLTSDQAAAFDRDGVVVVRDVFTAAEMTALDAALEPGNRMVLELLEQLPGRRLSVAGADTQLVAPNQVATVPELRAFVHHPALVDLCHDLVGPDVRLYWEQAVYKQPHSAAPVLWHQDNGYAWVEPQAYLTLWVAITDATMENGCISAVPGAHLGGTLRHRHTELGEECAADVAAAVDLPVTAGSVVAFSSLTPHATRVNTTDEVRKAYIVQYVPDGAAVVDPAPDGGPGERRPIDDEALHPLVLRDGEPVTAG
ncbi:MAG: phytanoyl-CoA dioxygenase family protein [Microthrixaceae bacterium]